MRQIKFTCSVISESWKISKLFFVTYKFLNVCPFDYTAVVVSGKSKIEKVPRGIRGEKSSKDMASSRNWSQQLER